MKLPKLKFGSVDDLICAWSAGRAFDFDGSNEKVEGGRKRQDHSISRRHNLRLDVGESSGREQCPDALANLIAIERLSGFLWQQLQQVLPVTIRNSRELDGLNDSSLIGGDSVGRNGGSLLNLDRGLAGCIL